MILLAIFVYIILGLFIGTLIVSVKNERLYKQLKKESDGYMNERYANLETCCLIFWYYVIWPIPTIIVIWFGFWKYSYIMFQKVIESVADILNSIGWYFKTKFVDDIKNMLKDKK